MKTILVPTDFSQYAIDALDYALKLADKIVAKVHILNVIDYHTNKKIDGIKAGDDDYLDDLIEKSKEGLSILKNKYPNAQLESSIKITTSITKEIIDHSVTIKADLIIMGSKGTSTIDEDIIGSNTEKIVRSAHCAVLTIKDSCDFKLDDIVFASDFKNVNQTVIDHVKFYQETFNAKLHLLRVCTPHNFENTQVLEDRMEDMAKKHGFKNYIIHTFNDFYEEDGIANFASHNDYDLICLATSGRTGMSHFFTGSIAEDVVNHSYKPVMTFNLKTILQEK